MTFTSSELNCLIWRYLQESGFSHTAYTFSVESHLDEAQIDSRQVISGALPTLVQKGLYYTEAELSSAIADDPEKVPVENLTLIEAVSLDPTTFRQARKPSESYSENDSKIEEWGENSTDRNEHVHVFSKDEVICLKAHSSEVFLCAWNPMINCLASGSGDATVRLWDLTTSNKKFIPETLIQNSKLLKHSSEQRGRVPINKDVTSLEWNSAGDHLATGCYDGFARIWRSDGSLRYELGAHVGPVFALKWNDTCDYVASAGADSTSVVWDVHTGEIVQKFAFHKNSSLDVEWINNDTFVSCSTDRTIMKCRLGVDRPLLSYLGHNGEINSIRYDPISRRLASCSDDRSLRIWGVEDVQSIHAWQYAHTREIYTIRWNPTGGVLASGSFDHTVKVWDVVQGKCIHLLAKHSDPVYSVAFSPCGRYLATGCFDRTLFVWDVHSGRQILSYVGVKEDGGIFEVSWNPSGQKLAAAASDGVVLIIDVRTLSSYEQAKERGLINHATKNSDINTEFHEVITLSE